MRLARFGWVGRRRRNGRRKHQSFAAHCDAGGLTAQRRQRLRQFAGADRLHEIEIHAGGARGGLVAGFGAAGNADHRHLPRVARQRADAARRRGLHAERFRIEQDHVGRGAHRGAGEWCKQRVTITGHYNFRAFIIRIFINIRLIHFIRPTSVGHRNSTSL